MEMKTLNQMKGSEIHRIIAAVLEVMEKAQFEPQGNVSLDLVKTDENISERWKMVFQKKNTNLDELNGIKNELGKNFAVNIEAKDRSALLIGVEAPSTDFVALLRKPIPAGNQRTVFDNSSQPASQEQ